MAWKNTSTAYGSISKWLHGVVGILVLILLVIGVSFSFLHVHGLRHFHKDVGVIVLFLVIVRILWKIINKHPRLPSSVPPWQRYSAIIVQILLLLASFVLPLSGWVMSTAAGHPPDFWGRLTLNAPGISVSRSLASAMSLVHYYTAWLISGLLIMHLFGAIKQFFIPSDNILSRMLPDGKMKH